MVAAAVVARITLLRGRRRSYEERELMGLTYRSIGRALKIQKISVVSSEIPSETSSFWYASKNHKSRPLTVSSNGNDT
jgi:hypothetical protein